MTEKQFEVTLSSNNEVHFTENGIDVISIGFNEYSDAVDCKNELLPFCNRLNNLSEENKELKQFKQRVFDLIDRKINEMEKKYKFGQEVYKGCPMHNIRYSINTLKELRKELSE